MMKRFQLTQNIKTLLHLHWPFLACQEPPIIGVTNGTSDEWIPIDSLHTRGTFHTWDVSYVRT